jgi:H+/Cl- antiporter ClcA
MPSKARPAPSRPARIADHLADFSSDPRLLVLSALALGIGALAAPVAWALVALIDVITGLAWHGAPAGGPASPADHRLGAWGALVPVAGGLAIGLLARFGSERIRGHGIPEALEAILIGESRMSPRVAALKPLSSAISIGTGGPFGAEGPIIMTGGAVGSIVAQGFHLSAAERKTLLVAGAAGGMAAIFSAPVAAILLSVELLLFEWKPRSFIPVALAAIAAGTLRVPLLGAGPIFGVAPHPPPGPALLAGAFGLGIVAGLCSVVLTVSLYAVEDLFQRLPVHWMWWPSLGGAVVGLAGLLDPRILGVGYGVIHALLRGELVGPVLVGLLVAKALAWTVALGSGTSGGVLAPLLMLGGGVGVLVGGTLPGGDPGLWATLGMAAMMAGTMRSPLTAMIFTLELTRDLNVLPALLASCVAAEAVTVLMLRRSILTEKVARRGLHLSREYIVDPLEVARVDEVMDPDPPTIREEVTVGELSNRIAAGDPAVTRHQGIPIVDGGGALVGIVTRSDVMRVLRERPRGDVSVLDAGARDLVVAHPDDTVRDAVVKLLRHGIGRLPVVDRDDPRRLLGYLGRGHVIAARRPWYRSEHERVARPAP